MPTEPIQTPSVAPPPNELALTEDERLLLATVCRLHADRFETAGFESYKVAAELSLASVPSLAKLIEAHDAAGHEARRQAGSLRSMASAIESSKKIWLSRNAGVAAGGAA